MKIITEIKKSFVVFNRFAFLVMSLGLIATFLLHVVVITIQIFPYIHLKMWMEIIPVIC